MTTKYTVQKTYIGGTTGTEEMERTDTFKGEVLGSELTEAHTLQTVECDHYENDDAEGIEIRRNFWVKKSLVKHIDWIVQFGARTISSVTFARPI